MLTKSQTAKVKKTLSSSHSECSSPMRRISQNSNRKDICSRDHCITAAKVEEACSQQRHWWLIFYFTLCVSLSQF